MKFTFLGLILFSQLTLARSMSLLDVVLDKNDVQNLHTLKNLADVDQMKGLFNRQYPEVQRKRPIDPILFI